MYSKVTRIVLYVTMRYRLFSFCDTSGLFTTQNTYLKVAYGNHVTVRHYEMQLFLSFVLYAAASLKINLIAN